LAGALWIIWGEGGWGGGGGIRQLINILFCGYRSDIHDPLSEKNARRNLYSSGAQVPYRVIKFQECKISSLLALLAEHWIMQYPKSRGFESHRGQANFSACPVWMHTQSQSNITNIIYINLHSIKLAWVK
jgi:hypothetical protein